MRPTTVFVLSGLMLFACAVPVDESANANQALDAQDEDLEGEDPASPESIAAGDALAAAFQAEDHPLTEDEMRVMAEPYAAIIPHDGIPEGLFNRALSYYNQHQSRFGHTRYIGIVDMKKHSKNGRFWIVDKSGGRMHSYVVAHGKYSDSGNTGYATSFSNTSGSGKTSLGPYQVAESYSGHHGLSARLDGLSSENSNVRRRAIVIHGASYVKSGASKQGRSLGCFAVTMASHEEVVDLLKGGSLLFASNDESNSPAPSCSHSSHCCDTGDCCDDSQCNDKQCSDSASCCEEGNCCDFEKCNDACSRNTNDCCWKNDCCDPSECKNNGNNNWPNDDY